MGEVKRVFFLLLLMRFSLLNLAPGIDKAPFQVTETGWGEFDVQIKILFVPESGEKPLTTYHRLKLHPWHPVAVRAPDASATGAEAAGASEEKLQMMERAPMDEVAEVTEAQSLNEAEGEADTTMQVDVKREEEQPNLTSMGQAPMEQPAAGSSSVKHPPVVHSWTYDEIVFPEPTEAFYEILLANPPTP